MKKFLLTALVATAMMTSCSKEGPDGSKNDGTASLYMKVEQTTTRAESAPGAAGMSTLRVQILDGASAVIADADASSLLGAGPFVTATGGEKYVMAAPLSSVSVLAYGFKSASHTALANFNNYTGSVEISSLQGVAFDDIPYVALTSAGAPDKVAITKTVQTPPAPKTGQVWTASQAIAPYFARFEVKGAPVKGTNIDNITIQNVYLNKYNNTYGAATVTEHAGNLAYFTVDGSGYITGTTNGTTTGDWAVGYPTTMGGTLPVVTSGNVQAFNLYPQATMPQVVVKVSVTTSAAVGAKTYSAFVTINNFNGATSISRGNIYQLNLADLTVNFADLEPEPNHKGADLYMTITVTDWTEVPITPGN